MEELEGEAKREDMKVEELVGEVKRKDIKVEELVDEMKRKGVPLQYCHNGGNALVCITKETEASEVLQWNQ